MSHTFADTAWIDAWWADLRGNETVRDTAATWAHGPLALVVQAASDGPWGGDVAIRLDVHEGQVRDARVVSVEQLRHVPTVISGTRERWQKLMEAASVDLVGEILQAHLMLRGDLTTVKRHAPLFDELMSAARRVDTSFDAPEAARSAEPVEA